MSDYDPNEDEFLLDPELRHSSGKEINRITTVPSTTASVLPARMTFGSINVGKVSAPQTAVISNNGDRPITIKSITHTGSFAVSFNNPGKLYPGEQLQLSVIFTPNALGALSGGIYVDTGNAAGEEFVRLVGVGTDSGEEPEPGTGGIPEAPVDDKLYGRMNADWTEIDLESISGPGTPSETQKANAAALGVLPTATHMGEFTGTNLPQNASAKSALQALSVVIDNVRSQISGLPVEPGDPGAPGVDAIVAFLTNENHTVTTESNGEVSSYTGASGRFYVFWGTSDVSSLFTLISLDNPQNLNVVYDAQDYRVTGGLDPAEPMATLTIRAIGGGILAGTNVDKTFTLSKAKGGTNAKTLTLLTNRQTIAYDEMGIASPLVQTTTFNVNKQNTTATVTWTITDSNGVNRVPVTNYLSSATGDSVTMTEPQFNLARNNTAGVIVTATVNDPTPIMDKISIVRVQSGEDGWDGEDGIDGIDGTDGKLIEFVWRRSATRPSTPVGNGVPTGWFDDPPQGALPLWMSKSKQELDGTIIEPWSVPIEHSGPPGANGEDGIDAVAYVQEATPPAPQYANQMWYKPSTKQYFYYSGTAWVQAFGNLARLNVVLADHIGAAVINSSHLSTGKLITNSAQIGNGVIDSAHIKNLSVDSAHIANLTIGTGKLSPHSVSAPFTFVGGSVIVNGGTNQTKPVIQDTGNVVVGDANDGNALVIAHGIMDGTANADTGSQLTLEQYINGVWVTVSSQIIGNDTNNGSPYSSMAYMMSHAVSDVSNVRFRVRAYSYSIRSAVRKQHYIRTPKIMIFGSKR